MDQEKSMYVQSNNPFSFSFILKTDLALAGQYYVMHSNCIIQNNPHMRIQWHHGCEFARFVLVISQACAKAYGKR